MAQEVDLITFRQPNEEERTLYVTGIPSALPRADKWHALWEAFTSFGLLYDVHLPMQQAHPDDPSATEYAFVKFYSGRAASTAQREARVFISGRLLRVQFATRKSAPVHPPPPLHISKCQELANHYLGFNGWSVRVVSIAEKNTAPSTPGTVVVCFCCVAALQVKGCEVESVGMGEGRLEMTNSSPVQKVQALGTAKKLAFHRACENAFSKVVITVLPSGKVGVQVFRDSEAHADNLLEDLLADCPPVNTTPQEPSERDHPLHPPSYKPD